MPNSEWHGYLKEAATEKDVVAVCNRFLTLWTFEELGRLPAACQPKTVVEVEDVAPYALKLLVPLGKGDATTAPMLHRMSTFFTKAALRLTQISAAQSTPVPADREPGFRAF